MKYFILKFFLGKKTCVSKNSFPNIANSTYIGNKFSFAFFRTMILLNSISINFYFDSKLNQCLKNHFSET